MRGTWVEWSLTFVLRNASGVYSPLSMISVEGVEALHLCNGVYRHPSVDGALP